MKQKNTSAPGPETLATDPGKRYNPKRLWHKLSTHARRAGREVVNYALQLHFAAQRPGTPVWAKRTAYGAIAYFILPMDAIPDFIVGAGYSDDLGALALAVTTLATYIDDEVRAQAREQLDRWFGANPQSPAAQTQHKAKTIPPKSTTHP